jgi:hypothetical protein
MNKVNMLFYACLHDSHFGHGTLLGGSRPPQEVYSLGSPKNATEHLLRTRFVSRIAKILCMYTNKISIENVVRRSYIQELRYIMVMHKETIQLIFLLHSSQSPHAAMWREKELYLLFKQFKQYI